MHTQDDTCKRRQRYSNGMWATVSGDRLAVYTAQVADVATAVDRRVGVEDLLVEPGVRHAEQIIRANNRREVAREYQNVVYDRIAAHEGDRAVVGVVAVDPLEAGGIEVELVERGSVLEQT